MSKLLAANLNRMWKSKCFRISSIFMFVMGIYFQVAKYLSMKQHGYESPVESMFFAHVLFLAIIISVLCSLFIGTEYSDGTVRNKVVVGNTRLSIYFSNFIVCIAAEVIMALLFIISNICVGIPLFGFFKTKMSLIIGRLLCAFLLAVALTAIFTFIAMLSSNKTITSVTCILGIFVFLFVGVYLFSRLSEPEKYEGYTMAEEGEEPEWISEPNPNYLRGTERRMYEFFLDFTPGGQLVQITSDETPPRMWQMSLYSVMITVVTTGAGCYFFRKKDLN